MKTSWVSWDRHRTQAIVLRFTLICIVVCFRESRVSVSTQAIVPRVLHDRHSRARRMTPAKQVAPIARAEVGPEYYPAIIRGSQRFLIQDVAKEEESLRRICDFLPLGIRHRWVANKHLAFPLASVRRKRQSLAFRCSEFRVFRQRSLDVEGDIPANKRAGNVSHIINPVSDLRRSGLANFITELGIPNYLRVLNPEIRNQHPRAIRQIEALSRRVRAIFGRIRDNDIRPHSEIENRHRKEINESQSAGKPDQIVVKHQRGLSYIQRLLGDSQRPDGNLFLPLQMGFLLGGALSTFSGGAILCRSVWRNRGERADGWARAWLIVFSGLGLFLFCCGFSMVFLNCAWAWLSVYACAA
jgi:hypothetical protein